MEKNSSFIKLFKPQYLLLDQDFPNQEAVFEAVDRLCYREKVSLKPNLVKTGLQRREQEATTGFGEGIAIPHCSLPSLQKSAVILIRLKTPVAWRALDHKPVTLVIVFVESPKLRLKSNQHLELMAVVTKNLLKPKIKACLLKAGDYNVIAKALFSDNEPAVTTSPHQQPSSSKTLSSTPTQIIALTSCIVGIAHTYLAAQRLEQAATKLNYQLKVETHGAEGVKNRFSDDDISQAAFVIVASDVALDLTRFAGKKVFTVKTEKAIRNAEATIKQATADAQLYVSKNQTSAKTAPNQEDVFSLGKNKTGKVIPHILSGVSYLVPVVVLGGLLLAFSLGLSKIIYGKHFDISKHHNNFLGALFVIGSSAFTIMIPIFGGFIAFSIGGKAAIAPAFVVCFIANSPQYFSNDALRFISNAKLSKMPGLSFIGSILFGFAIGYSVLWMRTWKMPSSLQAIMPIIIIPLLCGLVYGLIAIFLVGALVGSVLSLFETWITKAWGGQASTLSLALGLGFGFLIGAMTGFDVGGPINKIAFLSCVFLIGEKVYTPMGAMGVAIPCAPLGCGLVALLGRKYWEKELRTFSGSALLMGFIGISEGSIPFLVAKPKQILIANVVGSAIAGAAAGALGCSSIVAQGGPLVALLGGMGHTNSIANIGYGAWPWVLINISLMFGGGLIVFLLAWLLLWWSYNGSSALLKRRFFALAVLIKTKTVLRHFWKQASRSKTMVFGDQRSLGCQPQSKIGNFNSHFYEPH